MDDAMQFIASLKSVFRNLNSTDDDVANEMLDMMHDNLEIINYDVALRKAFRELNIWSRTEENTGEVLDLVQSLLNL